MVQGGGGVHRGWEIKDNQKEIQTGGNRRTEGGGGKGTRMDEYLQLLKRTSRKKVSTLERYVDVSFLF